ncbi:GyrI-like domain-containing protein [Fibrobacterales bacterium]|nr:GyrI-like domain-containing protein [Fibrobacterales bacterium]
MEAPVRYFEYTVYPLEGVWDITDEAKKTFDGTINKDDLMFNLMIRQPNFVTEEYALGIIEQVKKSKPHRILDDVKFEMITEGKVVQMLHKGSFDDESETFEIMEGFAKKQGLERLSKVHREVYLSDARRVEPAKLKTVLRFKVK